MTGFETLQILLRLLLKLLLYPNPKNKLSDLKLQIHKSVLKNVINYFWTIQAGLSHLQHDHLHCVVFVNKVTLQSFGPVTQTVLVRPYSLSAVLKGVFKRVRQTRFWNRSWFNKPFVNFPMLIIYHIEASLLSRLKSVCYYRI